MRMSKYGRLVYMSAPRTYCFCVRSRIVHVRLLLLTIANGRGIFDVGVRLYERVACIPLERICVRLRAVRIHALVYAASVYTRSVIAIRDVVGTCSPARRMALSQSRFSIP